MKKTLKRLYVWSCLSFCLAMVNTVLYSLLMAMILSLVVASFYPNGTLQNVVAIATSVALGLLGAEYYVRPRYEDYQRHKKEYNNSK